MRSLGDYLFWVVVFVCVFMFLSWVVGGFIEMQDPIPRLP
jgi:hypothetical protein